MTQEEIYNLYDKVTDILNGNHGYYYWYFCYNEEWKYNSLYFEVHSSSDKDEDYEWVEHWYIDECGRIHSEDTIYENYKDFFVEWSGR
jgi:hypothetical protein